MANGSAVFKSSPFVSPGKAMTLRPATALGGKGAFVAVFVPENNHVEYTDPEGRNIDNFTLTLRFQDNGGGGSGLTKQKPNNSVKTTKSKFLQLKENINSSITKEINSISESSLNGAAAASNVLSIYTGIMGEIADNENLIPGAATSLNGVSTVTGTFAAIPSAIKAKNEPNAENVAAFAGNVANVAFGTIGFGLGGLAGVSTTAYVKAGAAMAEGGTRLNLAVRRDPIYFFNSLFNYFMSYR
jgi:hypothetical protein